MEMEMESQLHLNNVPSIAASSNSDSVVMVLIIGVSQVRSDEYHDFL